MEFKESSAVDILKEIVRLRENRVTRAQSTNVQSPGSTSIDQIIVLEIEAWQARLDLLREQSKGTL